MEGQREAQADSQSEQLSTSLSDPRSVGLLDDLAKEQWEAQSAQ
jgi:hypothetical protein